MKTYIVSFSYTQYGKAIIEAENAEQAEENITSLLDREGLEGLDYTPTNREFTTGVVREHTRPSVRKLWEEFGNVPVNNNDEIDQDFYQFKKGTPKEDVWHWFEDIDPTFSVGEMLNKPKR